MAKNDYQFGQAKMNVPARGPMRVMEKPKDLRNPNLEQVLEADRLARLAVKNAKNF